MTSDTDLPHQQDTLLESRLTEKKSNSSWRYFSILLIIVNLLFVWLSPLIFLLPVTIIDFIAVRWRIMKRSPPWKPSLIFLLILNVIFFYFAGLALNQSGGGVAGFGILPFALVLLLIDSITISSYIYIHLHHHRAKIIFYIVLASIALWLLALSIFYSPHP